MNTQKSFTPPAHRAPNLSVPPAGAPHPYFQPQKSRFNPIWGCCGLIAASGLALLLILLAYFLYPARTRLVLMGIDRAPNGTAVSRTDTIILMQINPPGAAVPMLSIPRDLWVPIPGVGENRINTAHFYAEAEKPGSGPAALQNTIASNFGIRPDYYARIQFDGFEQVIDAMGGLDLNLPKTMGGLEAGSHHLSGAQALAFARDRKGSDDFFRQNQGQMVIRASISQMLLPSSWKHLPAVAATFKEVVKTDIPLWLMPRIGLALARASFGGFEQKTLTREMARPFTTSGGAQVLRPDWNLIHPLLLEMFGP